MARTRAPAKLAIADAPGVQFPTVYLSQGALQNGDHGLKAGGE